MGDEGEKGRREGDGKEKGKASSSTGSATALDCVRESYRVESRSRITVVTDELKPSNSPVSSRFRSACTWSRERWVWDRDWRGTWTCCCEVWSRWWRCWAESGRRRRVRRSGSSHRTAAPRPKHRDVLSGNRCSVSPARRINTEHTFSWKVKVHTLDIAPLRSESSPQKRSGMARVLKGFHKSGAWQDDERGGSAGQIVIGQF